MMHDYRLKIHEDNEKDVILLGKCTSMAGKKVSHFSSKSHFLEPNYTNETKLHQFNLWISSFIHVDHPHKIKTVGDLNVLHS